MCTVTNGCACGEESVLSTQAQRSMGEIFLLNLKLCKSIPCSSLPDNSNVQPENKQKTKLDIASSLQTLPLTVYMGLKIPQVVLAGWKSYHEGYLHFDEKPDGDGMQLAKCCHGGITEI